MLHGGASSYVGTQPDSKTLQQGGSMHPPENRRHRVQPPRHNGAPEGRFDSASVAEGWCGGVRVQFPLIEDVG